MTETKQPKILKALAAIQKAIGPIGKDEQVPAAAGGYSYRGIDAICNKVFPLLHKHGILQVPTVTPVYTSANTDARRFDVLVTIDLTLVHSDDGSSHFAGRTLGQGCDGQDKAAGKAHSNALKYLLANSFSIPLNEGDPHEMGTPIDVRDYRRPEPIPAKVGRQITDKQQSRLWEIANKAHEGAAENVVRAVLTHYGYTHTRDIAFAEYDTLVEAVEKWPGPTEAEAEIDQSQSTAPRDVAF